MAGMADVDVLNKYKPLSFYTLVYALAGEIADELTRARKLFPDPQHSLHEGFAVMKEEVDEVWEHVKVNQKKRDYPAIRKELIQVAAMAMRTILEVVDTENRT